MSRTDQLEIPDLTSKNFFETFVFFYRKNFKEKLVAIVNYPHYLPWQLKFRKVHLNLNRRDFVIYNTYIKGSI